MSVTEEAAPPAADMSGVDGSLTPDEEATIVAAQAVIFKACHQWAVRLLSAERPAAEKRVTDAEEAEGQARSALEAPQAVADHFAAELEECRADLAQCREAAEGADRRARIRARTERLAVEQEIEDLEEQVRIAVRATDPLIVAVSAAERETRAARGNLADLSRAIEFPLTHPRGIATPAYVTWQLQTGAWFGKTDSASRGILMEALRLTGVGAEVEENAIRAFRAGVPAAVAVGGNSKRWADGTGLVAEPGRPPVVTHGQATPAGLQAAPVVNVVPGPSGAEIMSGVRQGAGWPIPPPEALHKTR